MNETVLSTKGQVVIPKALREARGWHAGMSLIVEEAPQGLLLRPARPALFGEPSTLDEVFSALRYDGPPLSDEDIARALEEEGRRQK